MLVEPADPSGSETIKDQNFLLSRTDVKMMQVLFPLFSLPLVLFPHAQCPNSTIIYKN
jgi:hypothetical protein